MTLLNFTYKTLKYYRNEIRGNENISRKEASLKMTRNMLLAQKVNSEGYYGQLYKYGALWFIVKDSRIVWMRNRSSRPFGWKKDKEKYRQLNEELNITY
ncbi:hypothetical protein ACU3L3_07085 [Priestia endophytica]